MKTFASFILKETRHILRDKRTVLIVFGMPIVMMVLFGFAISNDIQNVRVAIVGASVDVETEKIVEKIDASEYFTVSHEVGSPEEVEALIRARETEMGVVFTQNYANHLFDHRAGIQLIADATDPNNAIQEGNYLQQVIQTGTATANMPVRQRMLYNPQMKSSYNFVPGIMGMILMLICAMMTAVSIVREKERGTMEVLLVSPVKPLMIIIAKAIPYMVLSWFILLCILLLTAFVLGVPIAGGVAWIFIVSTIYIFLSLSLGLLISVVAQTQLVAILVSAVILLMPSLMLSGMMYPIESMPTILQYVTLIVPARWYISAMRKLMIMGVNIRMVATELTILTAMMVALLLIALKRFNSRLE